MKRDVILSVILHLLVVAATVISMPFGKTTIDPNDVIKINVRAALPGPPPSQPAILPSQAITTPQPAVKPEEKAKPLPTKNTKKKTEKPKPKPKKSGVRPEESAAALAKDYQEKQIETDATGAGSPFAGATVDNSNFDYPYWFDQAFNKIASNWRNPVDAEGTLVCVITFQVLRSGRVMETEVEQSSGSDLFDEACVTAVERSNPFPPLPREFTEEIIGITVPFKYEPR